MRIPKITSLYGRIFAIFWFTMLLVLLSVLSLPHLDPRVARDVPADHLNKLERIAKFTEKRYAKEPNLGKIVFQLEAPRSRKDSRARIYLTDLEGAVLTSKRHSDYKLKAIRNFAKLYRRKNWSHIQCIQFAC